MSRRVVLKSQKRFNVIFNPVQPHLTSPFLVQKQPCMAVCSLYRLVVDDMLVMRISGEDVPAEGLLSSLGLPETEGLEHTMCAQLRMFLGWC